MTNKYIELYDTIFKNDNNYNLDINNNYCIPFMNYRFNKKILTLKENIIKLFDAEYVIFPKNNFYYKLSQGIHYFEKNRIICINYYLKHIVFKKIEKINLMIKSQLEDDINIIKSMKELFDVKKIKLLYFYENSIEPNILFKKIKFSIDEFYLPFNTFCVKRIEYKLKSICQLVEKMGAIKINIDYTNTQDISSNTEINIIAKNGKLGIKDKIYNHKKVDFSIDYTYDIQNQINNINLNIHELNQMIKKENDFYISEDQFMSDIDLKFLINSRCINLIEKYETTLLFNYANSFEVELIGKVKGYGIDLHNDHQDSNNESLHLKILFLNPYNVLDCITGGNISPYSQGFLQLCKLIKKIKSNKLPELNEFIEENKDYEKIKKQLLLINSVNEKKEDKELYLMINNFLESHLKLYNESKIKLVETTIDITINLDIDLIKTYNNIINLNFSDNELGNLFYLFFRNNLNYRNFIRFRNILLTTNKNIIDYYIKANFFNLKINNIDNIEKNIYLNVIDDKNDNIFKPLNKLIFISHQYHLILNYELEIKNIIDSLIKENINKLNEKKTEYNNIYNKLLEYIKINYKTSEQINFIQEYCIENNINMKKQNYFGKKIINYCDKINKFESNNFNSFIENKIKCQLQNIGNMILIDIKNNNFNFDFDINYNNNIFNEIDKILSINSVPFFTKKNILLSIIYHNFNLNKIILEIKKLFHIFFYQIDGFFNFFNDDEEKNINLKKNKLFNEIIKDYKKNKVGDLDITLILFIILIFEDENINKIFIENSFIQKMYEILDNIIREIVKNYDETLDQTYITCIKKEIPIIKILSNYQKFKIFFKFDNLENILKKIDNNQKIKIKKDIKKIFNEEKINKNILKQINNSINNYEIKIDNQKIENLIIKYKKYNNYYLHFVNNEINKQFNTHNELITNKVFYLIILNIIIFYIKK